jgi:hypothetical protein
MAALLWGCATVVVGFLLHLLIWRCRLPRYQTKTLLAVFFGTLAVVCILLATAAMAALGLPTPTELAEYLQIILFATAFTLAYTITYSALEADSPTLVMVRAIAAAGADGLTEADFQGQVSDDVLIRPRLADLVRDGMLVETGGRLALTPKGRRFVNIFIRYRALLGAGKGG